MNTDTCPQTFAVLSHFLDGESLEALDYLELEALREHRDGCPICRRALDRSRRLDAELASLGGRESEVFGRDGERRTGSADGVEFGSEVAVSAADRELDRMFARVDAESAELVSSPDSAAAANLLHGERFQGESSGERSSRVPSLRSGAVVAAAVLVGFSLAVAFGGFGGFGGGAGGGDPVMSDEPREIGRAPEESDAGSTSVPSATGESRSGRVRSQRAQVVRPLPTSRQRRRHVLLLCDAVRGPILPLLDRFAAASIESLGFPTETASVVRESLRDLRRQLVDELRGNGGLDVERALLALAVRDDLPEALAALERRLPSLLSRARDDRELRRLLLSLDTQRVDRHFLAWAEGSQERSDDLSMDLRAAGERPGRARLLISLWQELASRVDVDEHRLAERWFHGLGAAAGTELAQILDSSGNAVERRRAALACAAVAESSASASLLRLLQEPNRRLRSTAAYALGRLPAGSDGLSTWRPERSLRAEWSAALASRRDPSVQRAIDDLDLTDEERAFLISGRFDPEQFEVAATLFRTRALRSRGGF